MRSRGAACAFVATIASAGKGCGCVVASNALTRQKERWLAKTLTGRAGALEVEPGARAGAVTAGRISRREDEFSVLRHAKVIAAAVVDDHELLPPA